MTQLTQEQFLKDVANHQITINLDQGVYRDITIAHPNTMDKHFNITTRPGYLIFTGDMGSFTFYRLQDMFKFFRKEEIDPDYWHEKLEAIDSRGGAKSFSVELVKEILTDHLNDYLENLDVGNESINQIHKQSATDAIEALTSAAENNEHEFWQELGGWESEYSGGLEMNDSWEWDFKDFTYRYIWCCYAIVHAIKLYDEVKGEVAA